LVDGEHVDLPCPLLLSARLDPARVGLENPVFDGLLEDGLEQSVGVGLLGGVFCIPAYQVAISTAVMSSSARSAQVGRISRRSSRIER
jgi:hypothetical protein